MVKLTRGGVIYDLKLSPFKHDVKYGDEGYTYYFSSELNRKKFIARLEDHRDKVNTSLSNRFNIYLELNLIADIKLYENIEKRGFLIANTKESYECLSTIRLSGLNKINKS